MANEVLGTCPVCGEEMTVQRVHCSHCQTSIEGHFELCKFCQLNREQRYFAEVFIRNRGNIKEVEKELGISYPTVRSRLDAVIRALGYQVETATDRNLSGRRREILDALNQGELTSEEALKRIKQMAKD